MYSEFSLIQFIYIITADVPVDLNLTQLGNMNWPVECLYCSEGYSAQKSPRRTQNTFQLNKYSVSTRLY